MTLSLVPENSDVLKVHSEPFDFANPIMDPNVLASEMHRLMKEEGGIGLAANQVGFAVAVLVMDINGDERTCFNPEILSSSLDDIVEMEEGCLSFPSLYFKVKRPAMVHIRYQTADARWYEEDLDGIMARCFQHELDHLEGICFVDKVSKLVLNMAKRRRAKHGRK